MFVIQDFVADEFAIQVAAESQLVLTLGPAGGPTSLRVYLQLEETRELLEQLQAALDIADEGAQ